MKVNAWYRTVAYNKSVGGNSNSSHLRGVATDWGLPNVSKDDFIKYAKKWRSICNAHGVVGEAGLYKWGIHLGSSVKYSKKFYHWDSRSGKQVNMPFKELK
nr:MAG TPA: peptidase [Caudoviricetes sp.]